MEMEFGDKRNVKNYLNCSHAPLLPIELEEVTPPYLHILLGIVWRHHILLKKEVHILDWKIIAQEKYMCTEAGLKLKQYGNNATRVDTPKQQMKGIEALHSLQ